MPDRPAAAPPAVSAGMRVGRYVVSRKLGAGGMGAVWLARDDDLGRDVALKLLPLTSQTPPNLVKRFRAEAAAAAKLRHPNIVGVYEAGEDAGHLYMALEYVDGIDAERLLEKSGPLPFKRTVRIVRQINLALAHLHEQRLIHRDVKPSNVMLKRDGTALLTDLGLAKAIDRESNAAITRAGFTVGTVDYMAPEQARGSHHADIRSDLYSLGCTWFHMLTGSPPFPAEGLTARLQAHALTPPPDPRAGDIGNAAELTESAVAVLRRLMAKKPRDRHQTPGELADDLADAVIYKRDVRADDLADLVDDSVPRFPTMKPRPAAVEERPGRSDSTWVPIAILLTVGLAVLAALWTIAHFAAGPSGSRPVDRTRPEPAPVVAPTPEPSSPIPEPDTLPTFVVE